MTTEFTLKSRKRQSRALFCALVQLFEGDNVYFWTKTSANSPSIKPISAVGRIRNYRDYCQSVGGRVSDNADTAAGLRRYAGHAYYETQGEGRTVKL
jgi:hypothetical protein